VTAALLLVEVLEVSGRSEELTAALSQLSRTDAKHAQYYRDLAAAHHIVIDA